MKTNKSVLTALLFAAASLGANAATQTVSDSVISGTHDYGSDNVNFSPSSSSVTFAADSSVAANEIRLSGNAETNGTEFNAKGQLRIDKDWIGDGDVITAGSVAILASMATMQLKNQKWDISGAANFSNYFGKIEIEDSILSFGDGLKAQMTDILLRNCTTTVDHLTQSSGLGSMSGSLTVDSGFFTATTTAGFGNFGVPSGTSFIVKNGATVDLTGVNTKLESGGKISTDGVVNITDGTAVKDGALNISSFDFAAGTLEAEEIMVGSGVTLSPNSGTISAETLTVSTGATVVVADGATLNVSALNILSDAESISAGTTLDLDSIFGGDSAALEKVLGDVGEQISVKDASGNVYSCKYSPGDTFVTIIPEPSAFGLLAGIGALALVASRRRRAK